jgi:hypothetical protein
MPPAFAAAVGLLDNGPEAVVSQGGHLPVVFVPLRLAPELPVHWVGWVVAVTAVNDEFYALE